MAEQLAPIMPQFEYLPSDAKFWGDPVDYVVFDGYTDLRDGEGRPEDIEIVLVILKRWGEVNQRDKLPLRKRFKQGGFVLKRSASTLIRSNKLDNVYPMKASSLYRTDAFYMTIMIHRLSVAFEHVQKTSAVRVSEYLRHKSSVVLSY